MAAKDYTKITAHTLRFVYIVEDSERKLFKVGVTRNLLDRLRYLQVANSSLLVMLGRWPGTKIQETLIHETLAQYQKRSEWFDAPLDVIADAVSVHCGIAKEQILADIEGGAGRLTTADPIQRRIRHRKPKRKYVKASAPIEPLPIKELISVQIPVIPEPVVIPKIHWERVSSSESLVYFIPREGMPKRRWVCLGRVPSNLALDHIGAQQWIAERIEKTGLDSYDADSPYRDWLKLEDYQG